MKIPYLYRKIAELLRNNNGNLELPELQDNLMRFRIEKREAIEIAKELERQGIVVLDMSKGVNQHLKIRVCSKGMANFLTLAFVILTYCIALLVGVGVLL